MTSILKTRLAYRASCHAVSLEILLLAKMVGTTVTDDWMEREKNISTYPGEIALLTQQVVADLSEQDFCSGGGASKPRKSEVCQVSLRRHSAHITRVDGERVSLGLVGVQDLCCRLLTTTRHQTVCDSSPASKQVNNPLLPGQKERWRDNWARLANCCLAVAQSSDAFTNSKS